MPDSLGNQVLINDPKKNNKSTKTSLLSEYAYQYGYKTNHTKLAHKSLALNMNNVCALHYVT